MMVATIGSGALGRLLERTAPAARSALGRSGAVEVTATMGDDGGLEAWSADGALGVLAWDRCEVATAGVALLTHGDAAKVARRLTGEIALSATERLLTAVAEGAEAELMPVPPDAVPHHERPERGEPAGTAEPAALRAALRVVEGAAATVPDGRPALAGVQIEADGDRLLLAAADGYRAAVAWCPFVPAGDPWPEGGVVVPIAAIRALSGLLADPSGAATVDLHLGAGWLAVHAAGTTGSGWTWRSGLIDASFPGVRSVGLRAEDETTATVARAALLAASATAGDFATAVPGDGGKASRRVEVSVGAETIDVRGADATMGRVRRTVAAEVVGPPTVLFLNAAYLADGLAALPGERVRIGLAGAQKAVAIRAVDDPEAAWVLMPMTVGAGGGR